MTIKRIMFFVFVFIFIAFVSGCSGSKETLKITDSSKVILISEGNEQALTFTTFLENQTKKDSESFYVEFEINHELLSSKVEQTKFIVGEDIAGDKGKLYSVKAKDSLQIGGTLRVTTNIELNDLKEIIEKEQAVKVTLLNEDKETILSTYIEKFSLH